MLYHYRVDYWADDGGRLRRRTVSVAASGADSARAAAITADPAYVSTRRSPRRYGRLASPQVELAEVWCSKCPAPADGPDALCSTHRPKTCTACGEPLDELHDLTD